MIEKIKAQPMLELKNIVESRHIDIPIGISCSIPTPNEPFSKTLKRFIEYVSYFDKDQIKEYENILYSFELYGSFLDCIPLKKRYEIIQEKLFEWMLGFLENRDNKTHKESMKYDEPPKKIKKDINTIIKFRNMIDERLWIWNNDIYEQLDSIIEALEKDLKEKKFQIIPKHSYYGFPITKKQDLTTVLNEIIKNYKIKGASVNKKQLVDSIKSL